jgi:phosphatidylglycerol---prolipoprotein diacylglyceryl transferase
LIRIGPISVYWYGILIVGGAMLAAHIVSKLSRHNGHDPELAWSMLLWALITGIIGARIYHIISSWDYYRVHLDQMIGLQMSGFGIYGAVAGGLAGVWVFTKRNKLRFLEWADYCAPGLLLAQAIGRWGNFFNQELYGPPTTLPWGIYIAPDHRLPGLEMFDRFHPTFFYESVLNFGGFLVLLYLARNWQKGRLYGDLFFIYCLIYPFIRFFIEFLRPDAWMVGGIAAAQLVAIGSFVFASCLLIVRRKLRRPSMIYVPGTPWEPPSGESSSEEEAQQGKGTDDDKQDSK